MRSAPARSLLPLLLLHACEPEPTDPREDLCTEMLAAVCVHREGCGHDDSLCSQTLPRKWDCDPEVGDAQLEQCLDDSLAMENCNVLMPSSCYVALEGVDDSYYR